MNIPLVAFFYALYEYENRFYRKFKFKNFLALKNGSFSIKMRFIGLFWQNNTAFSQRRFGADLLKFFEVDDCVYRILI